MSKQRKYTYAWRDGFRFSGDPQRVGEALAAIDAKYNCLQPSVVVQAAQSKRSPLHEYFEWDDGAAARKYRDEQARHLIRAVRVITEDPELPSRPAFVHVRHGDQSDYRRPEVVVDDADLWASVIRETTVDLRGVERRLEELIRMERQERQRAVSEIHRSVKDAADQAELALNMKH